MFGREKRIPKQKVDIEELMAFADISEARASELYYECADNFTLDEIKERWTKADVYVTGLREYREREVAFQEKLASIPKLLAKPNMKHLAKAVLIQQEYLAHIQENYVSTGFGLKDKSIPKDPTSIFAR